MIKVIKEMKFEHPDKLGIATYIKVKTYLFGVLIMTKVIITEYNNK